MKIQLDTENKVIKVNDNVNLKELFDMVNNLLGEKGWEEYSLNTTPINITENFTPPWDEFFPKHFSRHYKMLLS